MQTDERLNREDAEQILRRTEYWHYPFQLPWAEVHASKTNTDDRHQQRRKHFFEPLLALHDGSLAGKRVLDLGCCQGFWTLEAARAGAKSCLGLDSSSAFIEEARALRTIFAIDNCEFQQAHLEEDLWWVDLEPFDVTLFLGLFYHLADPISVTRRAMALTKQTIVIDTVVQNREEPLLLLVPRNLNEPSTHKSGLSTEIRVQPTTSALVMLLKDGGFNTVTVLPNQPPMPKDYMNNRRVSVIGQR